MAHSNNAWLEQYELKAPDYDYIERDYVGMADASYPPARYTKKGNKVAVSGSIQLRNYEDNQGVKRTAVDIIVQDVEFLTPKTGESFDEADVAPRAAAPKRKPVLQAMDDDSDIPF